MNSYLQDRIREIFCLPVDIIQYGRHDVTKSRDTGNVNMRQNIFLSSQTWGWWLKIKGFAYFEITIMAFLQQSIRIGGHGDELSSLKTFLTISALWWPFKKKVPVHSTAAQHRTVMHVMECLFMLSCCESHFYSTIMPLTPNLVLGTRHIDYTNCCLTRLTKR